ncbi:unnamed protein product [Arctogadus glacialis]
MKKKHTFSLFCCSRSLRLGILDSKPAPGKNGNTRDEQAKTKANEENIERGTIAAARGVQWRKRGGSEVGVLERVLRRLSQPLHHNSYAMRNSWSENLIAARKSRHTGRQP